APGDAASVRADRRAHARARAGGDAGVSDPARVEPGVARIERDGGRGTGAVSHAVLDGGQGRRRRELPAHPDTTRWIGRLAPSSLGAGTGGATPLGDSCSHAPLPAVTTKSPCTNNHLAPGSACPERVNIRCIPKQFNSHQPRECPPVHFTAVWRHLPDLPCFWPVPVTGHIRT